MQTEPDSLGAAILAIGDELVGGQRLDTNSPWLSTQLAELGIPTRFHFTVGDDLSANLTAFRTATTECAIVIATGGLGPTADDLTREVLATLTGHPLVVEESSLDHIAQLFARRGRTMPLRNRVQAMLPAGGETIPNPDGTAPGIYVRVEQPGRPTSHVFALPGVPAEMRSMYQAFVRPRLMQLIRRRSAVRQVVVKCFGLGESELEARLPDLIRRGRQPTVGITVSQATISLRIRAQAETEDLCQHQIESTRQAIRQCLGPVVFGEGEDYELQHAVGDLLTALGRRVCVVEMGTRGQVTQWLAEADKASLWFAGGSVLAGNQGRPSENGTPADQAAWLAGLGQAARQHFQCDWALVVGPWPREEGLAPENHIAFAVVADEATWFHSAATVGHPELLRVRAAKQALDFLRHKLLEFSANY
jgi:nicotinamide-nucleotide amidase